MDLCVKKGYESKHTQTRMLYGIEQPSKQEKGPTRLWEYYRASMTATLIGSGDELAWLSLSHESAQFEGPTIIPTNR